MPPKQVTIQPRSAVEPTKATTHDAQTMQELHRHAKQVAMAAPVPADIKLDPIEAGSFPDDPAKLLETPKRKGGRPSKATKQAVEVQTEEINTQGNFSEPDIAAAVSHLEKTNSIVNLDRPPSTKAEHQAHLQGGNQQFPDIAQIFGRQAPIAEIKRKIEEEKPVIVETHFVMDMPDLADAYRMGRTVSLYINADYHLLVKDQVITEPWIIEGVMANGLGDALVPFALSNNHIQCPSCGHEFPQELAK